MIPEAAVEAAAEALYDRVGYSDTFSEAPQHRRDRFLTRANEALEAAAPHMLAGAWESGATAQAAAYGMDKDTGPNPYRPAT